MDLIQLLILLIIVGICSAIAEWIVGYTPGGLLLTMIVGVVGAYFGGWIGGRVPVQIPWPVQVGDVTFNLIWTIIGVILLLELLLVLTGRRPRLFGWSL